MCRAQGTGGAREGREGIQGQEERYVGLLFAIACTFSISCLFSSCRAQGAGGEREGREWIQAREERCVACSTRL